MSKCFLREAIEEAIRKESDPEKAAIAVCVVLENQGLSLFGNGWIDEDTELETALSL